MSDSLRPHGLQHVRLPWPSPTSRAYSNSCPLSQWCHPTISSSVFPFSSCLQSFPASGYFPMSQFFTSGSQSIGVSASASVIPMNIQDWFPLGWTGWMSLQSKGLSRIFSKTTVHQPLKLTFSFAFSFLLFYGVFTPRLTPGLQFSSVAKSCPTLCDPMNRSTPGLPVYHQLPEFTET